MKFSEEKTKEGQTKTKDERRDKRKERQKRRKHKKQRRQENRETIGENKHLKFSQIRYTLKNKEERRKMKGRKDENGRVRENIENFRKYVTSLKRRDNRYESFKRKVWRMVHCERRSDSKVDY